jgi:hypothetical protein
MTAGASAKIRAEYLQNMNLEVVGFSLGWDAVRVVIWTFSRVPP